MGGEYESVSQVKPSPSRDSEKGRSTRSSGRWDSRTLGYVSVGLSGLAVILVICTILTGRYMLKQRPWQLDEFVSKPLATEPKTSAFACIPCIKLLRDPTEEISDDPLLQMLSIEVKDGTENCCAYNSGQITALFESVARLNELPDPPLFSYNASDFKFSPVSAHKRLYPARVVRTFGIPEIPRRPPTCEFKPDDLRLGLEHHREVDILKKGLRIRHGGLYYIYTSIHFRPQSVRPCREFRYQTFAAYVEKVSFKRSGSQEILRVTHTCCDACINTQEVQFTGGVFVLHPGDVIRVKVMSYKLVQFNAHTSFAGLAMLGSPIPEASRAGNSDTPAPTILGRPDTQATIVDGRNRQTSKNDQIIDKERVVNGSKFQ